MIEDAMFPAQRTRLTTLCGLTLAIACLSCESAARAQEGAATVGVFGLLGLSGSVHYRDVDEAERLASSYGGGANLSYPLHRFFALGIQAHYMRWRPETEPESAGFFEGALTPRGQFRFSLAGFAAGVFLQVPVGVGVVDREFRAATGAMVEWSHSPVFVIGVTGGFEFFFTRRLGAVLQLGFLHHAFSAELSGTNTKGMRISEADMGVQVDQPVVLLGLQYALTDN